LTTRIIIDSNSLVNTQAYVDLSTEILLDVHIVANNASSIINSELLARIDNTHQIKKILIIWERNDFVIQQINHPVLITTNDKNIVVTTNPNDILVISN
jgi:hypothetical protein